MTMSAGTVTGYTLDAFGNPTFTGSGYALVLAQALAPARFYAVGLPEEAPLPAVGQTTPPYSPAMPVTPAVRDQIKATIVAVCGGIVMEAPVFAGVIAYVLANAIVPATGLLDSTGHACTGSTTVT